MEQFLAPSIQQLASDAVGFTFRDGFLPYRIPAAGASLLLLVATFFGQSAKHGDAAARPRRSDLLYLLALAVFLLALRWPVLAVGDLDGDESVAVSAALTRYLDPAYGVTPDRCSPTPSPGWVCSGSGSITAPASWFRCS